MARPPGFIKRAPRVDLRRTATLVNSDGLEMKVVVLDISASGFRLEVHGGTANRRICDAAGRTWREFPGADPLGAGNRSGRRIPFASRLGEMVEIGS